MFKSLFNLSQFYFCLCPLCLFLFRPKSWCSPLVDLVLARHSPFIDLVLLGKINNFMDGPCVKSLRTSCLLFCKILLWLIQWLFHKPPFSSAVMSLGEDLYPPCLHCLFTPLCELAFWNKGLWVLSKSRKALFVTLYHFTIYKIQLGNYNCDN